MAKSANVLRALAFTLAETLIVMGIIGVVAALTLPNLNSSTGDKEKLARYMKTYSELNDAIGRAIAVYGPPTEWIQASDNTDALKSKRFAERITEFMKISKNCGLNTGCGTSGNVKFLDGTAAGGIDSSFNTNDYKYILASGVSMSIAGYGTPAIEVDLDGPNAGAYTIGKDYFGFSLNMTTFDLIPYPVDLCNMETDAELKENCFKDGNCGLWILRTGNMDYLKADNTGKCPNGTQLSWSNTTCK